MTIDTDKLQKLVLMLSSEQIGEVANAASMITRLLGKGGKDWHWFAAKVVGGSNGSDNSQSYSTGYAAGKAAMAGEYMRGFTDGKKTAGFQQNANFDPFAQAYQNTRNQDYQQRADSFNDHRHAAEWIITKAGANLRLRDREFLDSMRNWRGFPTVKQAEWLNNLCDRYDYKKGDHA